MKLLDIDFINEAIEGDRTFRLPGGKAVRFGSAAHVRFLEDTLTRLSFLRDVQPTARSGRYKAASRKIYGDAANQVKSELRLVYAYIEKEAVAE